MKILVGDIGGSNIRLSSCSFGPDNDIQLHHSWRCSTMEFQTLFDVVQVYTHRFPTEHFEYGVFAVAAPTDGLQAQLTNANWTANVHRLPFPAVLLNDLEAAGWGTFNRNLQKHVLQHGSSSSSEVESSLLGIGTGLGLAHCYPTPRFVSPTEFGHVSFAPFNEQTIRLWLWWQGTKTERLTVEAVCSGRGFANLVHFIADEHPELLPTDWTGQSDDWGEWLSQHPEIPFTQQVWELFFAILGSVCGDVIVGNRSSQLALCGGVVDKNVALFQTWESTFLQALYDKEPMRHIVEESSICILSESKLQQIGCGLWYANQFA